MRNENKPIPNYTYDEVQALADEHCRKIQSEYDRLLVENNGDVNRLEGDMEHWHITVYGRLEFWDVVKINSGDYMKIVDPYNLTNEQFI